MCRLIISIELLFCFILLLVIGPVTCQNYKPFDLDREWIDGVYLSYDEFLKNEPTIRKFTTDTYRNQSIDEGHNCVSLKSLNYINESGYEEQLDNSEYWGVCKNGIVYVNKGIDLFRLYEVASVMLLYKVKYDVQTDYVSQLHSTVLTNSVIGSSETDIGSINFRNFLKLILYVDFYDGIIRDYNYDSLKTILSNDEELMSEYNSIKERKLREKAIFYFVKQYNKRNPPVIQIENIQFGSNVLFLQDSLKEY